MHRDCRGQPLGRVCRATPACCVTHSGHADHRRSLSRYLRRSWGCDEAGLSDGPGTAGREGRRCGGHQPRPAFDRRWAKCAARSTAAASTAARSRHHRATSPRAAIPTSSSRPSSPPAPRSRSMARKPARSPKPWSTWASAYRWRQYPVVDKHSVGGLPGNRTTPIVVAIVAACGLTIPKTSSRAITSPAGTADTMETMAPRRSRHRDDAPRGGARRRLHRRGAARCG